MTFTQSGFDSYESSYVLPTYPLERPIIQRESGAEWMPKKSYSSGKETFFERVRCFFRYIYIGLVMDD